METSERYATVIGYLAENFGCGNDKVSFEDVIEGGRMIADEIGHILDDGAFRRRSEPDVRAGIEALGTIAEVWSGGFALASGNDYADAERTVSDVVVSEHARLQAATDYPGLRDIAGGCQHPGRRSSARR